MENNQQLKQSESNTQVSSKLCEKWDLNSTHEFFKELSKSQILLRTYGKQAQDLQTVATCFMEILGDFEPTEVLGALKKHNRNSGEFPTPYDLICIIEEKTNGRDKPNASVYNNLCRRQSRGEDLSSGEYDYIKQYEAYYIG